MKIAVVFSLTINRLYFCQLIVVKSYVSEISSSFVQTTVNIPWLGPCSTTFLIILVLVFKKYQAFYKAYATAVNEIKTYCHYRKDKRGQSQLIRDPFKLMAYSVIYFVLVSFSVLWMGVTLQYQFY